MKKVLPLKSRLFANYVWKKYISPPPPVSGIFFFNKIYHRSWQMKLERNWCKHFLFGNKLITPELVISTLLKLRNSEFSLWKMQNFLNFAKCWLYNFWELIFCRNYNLFSPACRRLYYSFYKRISPFPINNHDFLPIIHGKSPLFLLNIFRSKMDPYKWWYSQYLGQMTIYVYTRC